ncbi:L-threonylcarbamoyladenylate synthase [Magnetospira thiophila]
MTPILPATADNLAEAARLLDTGHLVAFPTETVYGLGGDATSDRAVADIFAAKGRPSFNPLITHVPDLESAGNFAVFDQRAFDLAAAFWPGPLTLVLRRLPGCRLSDLVSAGLDTVALRVPGHPLARELLQLANVPVAAPSANRSGHVSPTTADHVRMEFPESQVAAILDGGPCVVGLESTVIDVSGDRPTLLRPGGLTAEEIERVCGPLARAGEGEAPRSPGMLARHYAPSKPLRLNAGAPRPGEAFLSFGDLPGTLNLSRDGDPVEAAAHLFAMLRQLEAGGFPRIAVAPIPERGLGRAINDRLRRAATLADDTRSLDDWPEACGAAMPCLAITDPDDEGD